jgi:hypothetical protein
MSDKNIKVERKEYHRVTATFKFLFPKKDVLKEFGTLDQFEKKMKEGTPKDKIGGNMAKVVMMLSIS